jgi:hypothetical protein
MDKITHEHLHKHSQKYGGTHGDKYPYIDFDEDGNAYLVTERDAIPYPYANTISDEDTGRAGHTAENGNVRAGNKRVDPDHNGDS